MNPENPSARDVAERIVESQENYELLSRQLRSGHRPPIEVIDATLAAALRTWRDLVTDVLAGDGTLRPGDACPECSTPLRIYSSRRGGSGWQTQYFNCPQCGHSPRPNKLVTPVEMIRRRCPRKPGKPACRDPPA